MIEFAPFQKFVKGKPKADPRQGTIDTSPEYKEFLDSLTQPQPSPSDPIEANEDERKTTPLIEFLRSQKTARAEKERVNREKMRIAKIAAVQAKANAQTAKLRAEKMQKVAAEGQGNKSVESGKQVAGRGGRGGKAAGRGKDVQRAKAQQQRQQQQQQLPKAQEGAAITLIGEASTNETPVVSFPSQNTSPITIITTPTPTANTAIGGGGGGGQGFRGGRGRGRARPHGVYRPGAGRGGRRGGGASNEGRPPVSVAEV